MRGIIQKMIRNVENWQEFPFFQAGLDVFNVWH